MSPKKFIIRTAIALVAVLCLSLDAWLEFSPVRYLGLIFYFVCFAMYLKELYLALFKMRKVTADLLVVTVMTVSLAADQPLSGALVAWFISMGLAISFTIMQRTNRKISALTSKTTKPVRILRDGAMVELSIVTCFLCY